MASLQIQNLGRQLLVEAARAILPWLSRAPVGEAAGAIRVASPRAEAFGACRFAVDALKSKVPTAKAERAADARLLRGAGTP